MAKEATTQQAKHGTRRYLSSKVAGAVHDAMRHFYLPRKKYSDLTQQAGIAACACPMASMTFRFGF
jgi:hypothetical protein